MCGWKQRILWTGVCLAGILVLPWITPTSSAQIQERPGNPRAGRDLFLDKGCMRCHSVWSESNKKGPNLSSVGMGRNLYELGAVVWTHWSRMNEVIQDSQIERLELGASEFQDIISYLYYLNYYAEPADAGLGEATFEDKGCARCHAREPHENQGQAGRPVYQMGSFQTPITLAVAVWNHGTDMAQQMKRLAISWPQFKGKEVANLVAFIQARTGASPGSRMEVPGDIERGQRLFRTKSCAQCHVGGGSSRGPDLASLQTAVSLSSMIGDLWNHYPQMSQTMQTSGVAYPKITLTEMEDLLAYVYWLRAYGLRGKVSAGQNLYDSKKCITCHASGPGDSKPAPDLVGSKATESVYSVLAAIWNHGPNMDTMLQDQGLPWPTLTGDEMRDLIAFFRKGKP